MPNRMLERFREYVKTDQFNAIRIGLASPEKIRTLSYGEVKKLKPSTIVRSNQSAMACFVHVFLVL